MSYTEDNSLPRECVVLAALVTLLSNIFHLQYYVAPLWTACLNTKSMNINTIFLYLTQLFLLLPLPKHPFTWLIIKNEYNISIQHFNSVEYVFYAHDLQCQTHDMIPAAGSIHLKRKISTPLSRCHHSALAHIDCGLRTLVGSYDVNASWVMCLEDLVNQHMSIQLPFHQVFRLFC